MLSLGLVRRGLLQEALALVLMFTAYLRPGEALGLREEDLVVLTREAINVSINLHPSDRQEQSKVGLTDETILLDSKVVPSLGQMLARLRLGHPHMPLFRIDYKQLKKAWEEQLQAEGLQPRSMVLYQLRHSGPSHDRLHNHRPLLEVKRRGRWAADSSIRRYEAHAKIQQEFQRLSIQTQARALASMESLEKELLKCSCQTRPRTRKRGL